MTFDRSQRPDARQLEQLRGDLRAAVDRVVAAWPTIDRQSREMTRGFAGGEGLGVSGGGSDPTSSAGTDRRPDPATKAAEWLAGFKEATSALFNLDDRRSVLLPVDPAEVDRQRINAEICTECGQPIVNGGKRLDGALYHNGGTDPPCFDRARNRVRGRRGNGGYSSAGCEDGAA